jgi:FMN-dependent NADH-azoreductase
MKVLHVCASPRPIEQSSSKQMAAAFFVKLAEKNGDVEVTNVDLYHSPPPFLSFEAYRCLWQPVYEPGYEPTAEERKAAAYATSQAEQLRDSDVLVLTMPMWNFGMPAIMKAWLDEVMVPNALFTIEPDGVKGLHQIRRVILLISSGAAFKEGDPTDALTPEISAIMNYIGITDIMSAWADGQNPVMHGDHADRKAMAIEAAQELAEEVADMKL